ncbi:MAG: Protein-disulfide isomerase [Burkholderiales bacterium]|jgi:predicted DsbA family dithiol-disulfide isomerase|nr:Protein-disulfide isomerase [Burkholderiales bacterium]
MKEIQIEVASDVVCPWCYIGKKRLEKAIALLDGEVKPRIRWLPFQLNPTMPKEGIPRAEYRKAKFGSLERSRALDARVIAEGKGEGIDFAFERIERTPNTSQAHRLIALAEDQDSVVNALFKAYFEDAQDIGDPQVLAGIAAQCGVQGWPEKANDVSPLEEEVRSLGISAVPTYIFARRLGVAGAYPPEQLAEAMRQAAA